MDSREARCSSWARHRSGWREHEKNGSSVAIWCQDLPKKMTMYMSLKGIPKGKPSSSRLHNLAFSLDLPGISRFFEAAGLKSRYFAIQRDVKPQIFFGRSIHHNKPLGLIFSCSRGFTPHRAQPPRLAPPESTYWSVVRHSGNCAQLLKELWLVTGPHFFGPRVSLSVWEDYLYHKNRSRSWEKSSSACFVYFTEISSKCLWFSLIWD